MAICCFPFPFPGVGVCKSMNRHEIYWGKRAPGRKATQATAE